MERYLTVGVGKGRGHVLTIPTLNHILTMLLNYDPQPSSSTILLNHPPQPSSLTMLLNHASTNHSSQRMLLQFESNIL
jgi:hypothetical protein